MKRSLARTALPSSSSPAPAAPSPSTPRSASRSRRTNGSRRPSSSASSPTRAGRSAGSRSPTAATRSTAATRRTRRSRPSSIRRPSRSSPRPSEVMRRAGSGIRRCASCTGRWPPRSCSAGRRPDGSAPGTQPVGYAALGDRRRAHRLGLRRAALCPLRAVRARAARHPGLRAAASWRGASRATSATTRSAPAWCWRLFACVGGLALTGWLYTTDRFWGDETVERSTSRSPGPALALVALHVAGVALASFRHRENLVAAMISGDRREPEEHDIA